MYRQAEIAERAITTGKIPRAGSVQIHLNYIALGRRDWLYRSTVRVLAMADDGHLKAVMVPELQTLLDVGGGAAKKKVTEGSKSSLRTHKVKGFLWTIFSAAFMAAMSSRGRCCCGEKSA